MTEMEVFIGDSSRSVWDDYERWRKKQKGIEILNRPREPAVPELSGGKRRWKIVVLYRPLQPNVPKRY